MNWTQSRESSPFLAVLKLIKDNLPLHELLINGAFIQVQAKQLLQTPLPPPVVVHRHRVPRVRDRVVRVARVRVLVVVRVCQSLGGRLTLSYLGIVRVGCVDRHIGEWRRLCRCIEEDRPPEEEQASAQT